MLLPNHIQQAVIECAHWADRIIRGELIEGVITSENDYTSNFTGAFRREINSRNIPELKASSYVLSPGNERTLGADAAIILANKNEFKVGVFEAKWPRLSTHKNYWDSIQVSSKRSHFHDQLCRQRGGNQMFAIWEMFYCEYMFEKQPPYFPDLGSACVWHDSAYQQSESRSNNGIPWSDQELRALLTSNSIGITDVLTEICECRKGKKFSGTDYQRPFLDFKAPRSSLVIRYSGDIA